MTRHITIQADATPDDIDSAIAAALQQLSEQHKESMELVNVSLMFRPHNGDVFCVVVAKGTGQVAKTVKPKKPKEQSDQ